MLVRQSTSVPNTSKNSALTAIAMCRAFDAQVQKRGRHCGRDRRAAPSHFGCKILLTSMRSRWGRMPMARPRRGLALSLLSVLMLAPAPAWAQDEAAGFPSRAIRIVVPVPAGGPADDLARVSSQGMTEGLGQAVGG